MGRAGVHAIVYGHGFRFTCHRIIARFRLLYVLERRFTIGRMGRPDHRRNLEAYLAVFAIVGWVFTKSRTGIALRAIADDQQVSLAMGIDVSDAQLEAAARTLHRVRSALQEEI